MIDKSDENKGRPKYLEQVTSVAKLTELLSNELAMFKFQNRLCKCLL